MYKDDLRRPILSSRYLRLSRSGGKGDVVFVRVSALEVLWSTPIDKT